MFHLATYHFLIRFQFRKSDRFLKNMIRLSNCNKRINKWHSFTNLWVSFLRIVLFRIFLFLRFQIYSVWKWNFYQDCLWKETQGNNQRGPFHWFPACLLVFIPIIISVTTLTGRFPHCGLNRIKRKKFAIQDYVN